MKRIPYQMPHGYTRKNFESYGGWTINIPSEVAKAVPVGQVFRYEVTEDGILLRACAPPKPSDFEVPVANAAKWPGGKAANG